MEIGADADFTVIDLNKEYVIDEQKTESMAKYNPLHGMKLKGKPVQTIVRGNIVFEEDKGITGEAGYGEFVPRQSIQRLERTFKYEKYNEVKVTSKETVKQ
jgi:N-acyl-D-aspartate/D-glutamate deacylase